MFIRKNWLNILLCLVLAVAGMACDDNGGSSSGSSQIGSQLSRVTGATGEVQDAANGYAAVSGATVTESSTPGVYNVDLGDATNTGNLVLVLTGGTEIDDATGTETPLDAAFEQYVVLPATFTGEGIQAVANPFTTMAYYIARVNAESNGGALTDFIESAKSTTRSVFGFGLDFDPFDANGFYTSAVDTDAERQGILAQAAAVKLIEDIITGATGATKGAASFGAGLIALALDLADGDLDGGFDGPGIDTTNDFVTGLITKTTGVTPAALQAQRTAVTAAAIQAALNNALTELNNQAASLGGGAAISTTDVTTVNADAKATVPDAVNVIIVSPATSSDSFVVLVDGSGDTVNGEFTAYKKNGTEITIDSTNLSDFEISDTAGVTDNGDGTFTYSFVDGGTVPDNTVVITVTHTPSGKMGKAFIKFTNDSTTPAFMDLTVSPTSPTVTDNFATLTFSAVVRDTQNNTLTTDLNDVQVTPLAGLVDYSVANASLVTTLLLPGDGQIVYKPIFNAATGTMVPFVGRLTGLGETATGEDGIGIPSPVLDDAEVTLP